MQQMSLADFLKQPVKNKNTSLGAFLAQPPKSNIASVPTFPQTLPEKIEGLAKAQLGGESDLINNIGGGLTHALLSSNILDPLGKIFNAPNSTPIGANAASPIYKGATIAGNMIPALIGGEAAPEALAPNAGNFLKNILGGAAGGAAYPAQNATGVAQNALIGGAGGAALGGIPLGLNAIKKFNPISLPNTLTSKLYNDISGGLDKQDLNALNSSNIINNYNAHKTIGNNMYNGFMQNAQQEGFLPDINLSFDNDTGKVVNKGGGKGVFLAPETHDLFNNLLNPTLQSPTKPLSSDLTQAYQTYKASPSLQNAHTLQSQIGSEANGFLSAINRDPNDIKTGRTLNKLRSMVNTDIKTNLAAKGTPQLGQQLNNASAYWAQNVVPYTNQPMVRRLIIKGNHPPNVLNLLAKTDASGNMDVIRNHLLANPQQGNSLLAQQLSGKATKSLGDINANLSLTDAVKKYESAPDLVKDLFNNNAVNKLQNINTLKKVVAGGGLLAAGAAAVPGAHLLGEF